MLYKPCKYLDYDGEYTNCTIEELPNGVRFWQRPLYDPKGYPEQPVHVQFCKLRGRINSIFDCYEPPGSMSCYELEE